MPKCATKNYLENIEEEVTRKYVPTYKAESNQFEETREESESDGETLYTEDESADETCEDSDDIAFIDDDEEDFVQNAHAMMHLRHLTANKYILRHR